MVRFISIVVVGVSGWSVIASSSAWSQQPGPAEPAPLQKRTLPRDTTKGRSPFDDPPNLVEKAELLGEILGRPTPKLASAELAGMVAGAKPAVLSLEQAYILTLIRARTPAALRALGAAKTLDAVALEDLGKRADAGDFSRFRKEFLSSAFRDPTPSFFAVLKHRQALDSARDQVAFSENMRALFEKLSRSETGGVSQLQIDQLDQHVLLSQQSSSIELISYRTAADELKVALGLPVATPLVVDESILWPFASVFISIDAWQRKPGRSLQGLKTMHDQLPRLGDVKIGDRALSEVVQGTLPEEQFFHVCIDVASKHRPTPGGPTGATDERNALELRIRRFVRSLILIHKNYEVERKRMEVAVPEVDQWIEQLTAPPIGGRSGLIQQANAPLQITGLMQAQSRLYRGRSDFVSLWLEYKEQSSALYRELGMMPYDNWQAFHRSFLPEAGRPPGQGERRADSEPPSAPAAPKTRGPE